VCRDKGKNHYVGQFDIEIEAAPAYDRKAFQLFGEYAWLNFPAEHGMVPPRRRLCNGTGREFQAQDIGSY